MDKAVNGTLSHGRQAEGRGAARTARKLDWRRKVSDHVAFGLLVYTGMHIFWTMTQLKSDGGSIMPYFALIVLVAAIIPACRWMEDRWNVLSDAEAADPALRPVFTREMALLWIAAVGLPVALTYAFKGMAALF
ncbi:hypothetical protein [Aurantiacibacter luteus]|uniref:Uncharacterized protein n=1 Tax=Aurantiacibacter luteus TaxID=1581420 RepID=A0A0G9MUU3_9SPHN|nr:hypothetical protein [Aurantiacibacter luteus]KLE34507.1 hypothetical protein AAW00_09835 [Aurantiacibacter luteus]